MSKRNVILAVMAVLLALTVMTVALMPASSQSADGTTAVAARTSDKHARPIAYDDIICPAPDTPGCGGGD